MTIIILEELRIKLTLNIDKLILVELSKAL